MIKIKSTEKDTFDFQEYLANRLKSPIFRKYYNEYGKQLEAAYHISGVKCQLSNVSCSRTRGSLLLELLIAISILAVVLSVGSQAVFVSMQSGKVSSESDVGMSLASEALEATRAVADEKWQNVYTLAKGSPYHPVQSGENKWTLVASSEAIALNTANYTRSVAISNVSRDPSTRMIETTYDSAHDDPSTQQVVATVSWQGSGSPITMSDYLLRWRNKACNQTDWSGGAGSGAKGCPDNTYEVKDAAIDTSGGTLKLQ